jgi:ceramide glucosyltransferase
VNIPLAALALLSLALTLWQWLGARRFPLHRRLADTSFAPAVTLLKPLKGCDAETESCLRSWFVQDYAGPVQLLFGVAAADDPVCDIVRKLLAEFPARDAQLVVCPEILGANLKVSKLIQLERRAAHGVVVISDADVRVPPDFLANAVAPLRDAAVGLVNCFYRLANPVTAALRWEAVAINADFWSSVLQARSLAPLDFALGAAMLTRRETLAAIGGFAAIVDCLADDYQLGHRIAARGGRIELSPVVVDCWDPPKGWAAVWRHQLRWARTIRVSKPVAYCFSLLSNATLWPLLWVALRPTPLAAGVGIVCLAVRGMMAWDLQRRLNRAHPGPGSLWLAPLKDLLQFGLWVGAFLGRDIEWRGERYRLRNDGTMVKAR